MFSCQHVLRLVSPGLRWHKFNTFVQYVMANRLNERLVCYGLPHRLAAAAGASPVKGVAGPVSIAGLAHNVSTCVLVMVLCLRVFTFFPIHHGAVMSLLVVMWHTVAGVWKKCFVR